MDMAAVLEDLTYRLLASARNGTEARQRAAIVAHWAQEQGARLAAGKRLLRVDNEQLVAEALAGLDKPSARRGVAS
ncbi:MAG: hypothetical protein ABR540_02140 [Acidimicrobiales bacterium]